jgi:RHS repeat-associated protein
MAISRSPIFSARFYLSVALTLLLSLSALAQSTQTAARPDRGINPGGAYSVSDIENISLTNGNMNLSIPLASLPAIAGGKLGLTLRATYNSKLWDIYSREARYRDLANNPVYTTSAPQLADRGGWYIGASYAVIFRNAHDDDFGYVQTNQIDDPDSTQLAYQYYRAVLVTPDGSEHNLYTTTCNNGGYVDYTGGHRHDYLLGYCKDNPYASGPAKSYYTADGTYISATITPSSFESGGPTWTLYMRDGTQVTKSSDGIQRIKDTNGNSIKIFTDSNGTHYQDEQTLREIRLTFDSTYNNGKGQYQAWYQTVTGIWQHIDINMKNIQVKGLIYNKQSWNPETEGGGGAECTIQAELTPSESIKPMVEEIVFPVTEPTQPGQRYSFSYNSDVTSQVTAQIKTLCQEDVHSYTRETSTGLGELSQMVMPSGATVNYTYAGFGTQNGPLEFADPTDMARRYVATKSLTHDGTADVWSYTLNTDGSGGSVQGPDGSVTTETAYPHDHAYSHYFGMTGKSGLAYRTNQSNQVQIERHWTLMPFSGAVVTSPGSSSDHIPFNTVVDAEYSTIAATTTNPAKMSAKTFQYDYNGNLLQTTEYDWFDPSLVTRDAEGVPTGVPSGATVLRVTNSSYYNSAPTATSVNVYARRPITLATPWILSAPQETVVGASQTRFSYDGQSYGTAPTAGNLTTLSRWNDVGNSWINTTNTYDSYGNVATMTDARGKVTQIFYDDATHVMPTRVVVDPQNGTGEQTSATSYDFSTGAVLTKTDPNNQISTVVYTNQLLNDVDPFGRPGIVYSPAVLVNGTSYRQKSTTSYLDSQRQIIATSDLNAEEDGLLRSRTTADQLGRTVLAEQNEDGTSNYTISSQTVYEQAGKVTYQSNAHRSTASATDGWTRATKDLMGRVTEVATFDGPTQPSATATNWNGRVLTNYDSIYTTVTDQAGKVRRSVVNALGQLVRIDEPIANDNLGTVASPAQPTSYTYDVLGNLTQVTQGAQTRTFTYSSLSRLTSATNPEIHNAQGVAVPIAYQYDSNGNLTLKTDARGVTTTYVYDALNRVTSRSYSDGTPAVTYTYDMLTNGKGRLSSVSSSVSTNNYTGYDSLGRLTGSSQVTDGQTYAMSYGYNLAGALTSETYPSGRVVTTAYDNVGRLSQVSGQKTGEANKTYTSQLSYSAHGAITDLKLGNNLWEHTSFNNRLQPTEVGLGTTQSGIDRLKLNYAYGTTNNNGNVQTQTISVPGGPTLSQSYSYDQLNRLQSAEELNGTTQSWKQTFVYDRYGNRTFDAAQTTMPSPLQNPGINIGNDNRINANQGYGYDVAGNLITAPNQTFTYDAENRQASYNGGNTLNGGGTFAYDGDGKRVKKIASSGTTIFVYDASGQMVAEYTDNTLPGSGGTSYLTADTLGTPRIITGADGSVKARHDYQPFGEEIGLVGGRTEPQGYVVDNVKQKFTAKDRDNETGLDYFGARYYANAQGRFTSPDELLNSGRLESPQTWNRYAYVLNNPLAYTDPTGFYEYAEGTDGKYKKRFEAQLLRAKDQLDKIKARYGANSAEYTDAKRAIDGYGDPGVKNGVTVKFGMTSEGSPGETGGLFGNDGTKAITVTIDMNLNKSDNKLLGTITHEGSHVQDRADLVDGILKNPAQADAVTAQFNVTREATETRAYTVESVFAEFTYKNEQPPQSGGGATVFSMGTFTQEYATLGRTNIWNPSWAGADVAKVRANRSAAISKGLHGKYTQEQLNQRFINIK